MNKTFIEQLLLYLASGTDQRAIDDNLILVWQNSFKDVDSKEKQDHLFDTIVSYVRYNSQFPTVAAIFTAYARSLPKPKVEVVDKLASKSETKSWCMKLKQQLQKAKGVDN